MNKEEINAFVAGFFEGDGTLSIYETLDHSKYCYTRVDILFTNSDIKLLKFCQSALGGHIYKEYMDRKQTRNYPHKKQVYQLRITSKNEVRNALRRLLPYLISTREKTQRALELLGA